MKELLVPIQRPPAAVYDAIMGGQVEAWPHVRKIERAPNGPLALGTTEILYAKFLGWTYTVTLQVSQIDARSCIMAVTKAPFGATGTMLWEVLVDPGSINRSLVRVVLDIPQAERVPGFIRSIVSRPDIRAYAERLEGAIPAQPGGHP
jgi:hypothetical protein